jgi:hypothetical protein
MNTSGFGRSAEKRVVCNLCHQRVDEDTREIAPGRAGDETKLDRVGAQHENDRDRLGRCLGGKRRRSRAVMITALDDGSGPSAQ